MKQAATLFLSVSVLYTLTSTASYAQTFVIGEGPENGCYNKALTGDQGSNIALALCDKALQSVLKLSDRASTHNNRGILRMRKGKFETAQIDFKEALKLKPSLTEVHINYAALLIKMQNYDTALTSLDIAIADKTNTKLPAAYYNRAIIYDKRQNYKQAYKDLKAALKIKPDWPLALEAIGRYEVVSKPSN